MLKQIALFLCFMIFTAPQSVSAQESTSGAINIAVVDVQQLMSASRAAKSIQSQGNNLRDEYQDDIKKIEAELKDLEAKLMSLPKDTSKEDFMKEREKFQKRLVDGQKEVVALNQKLDKAVATALNKLRDEIVEIVSDMATDNQYDLVISRADVVIVSKSIDITAQVMKELDRNVKSIKVKG